MSSFASVYLISNSNTINLDDGSPFWFLGDQGLGASPLHRISERGPVQHGETDLGYRLDPRLATLILGIEEDNPSDFWTSRSALIGYFAPYHNPALRLTLPNGAVRQLDIYHTSDLDMPSNDRFIVVQKLAITVKAPDPTFYDPTQVAVNFDIGGGSDQFIVPTPVPTGIGASTISQEKAIAYSGTWVSYPQIRITGPITDCVINNLTTGEKLDFTGVTISSGDYYDIDCRYGQKTVVDAAGINRIANLTSDSDLATFHLQPDSALAPGGTNTIQVTGSTVDTATTVNITYYLRYLGV